MARRSPTGRFPALRQGQRRETLWVGGIDTQATIAAGANPLLIGSFNAAALALRPFTIVRTRGLISLASDQVAASEIQHAAFGIAIVSDQASAIGVTAIPTPRTDSASDLWFVYEWLFNEFVLGDSTGFQEGGVKTKEIDSKAMRKVEDGEDLVAVVEGGLVGLGFDFGSFFRVLIKLH